MPKTKPRKEEVFQRPNRVHVLAPYARSSARSCIVSVLGSLISRLTVCVWRVGLVPFGTRVSFNVVLSSRVGSHTDPAVLDVACLQRKVSKLLPYSSSSDTYSTNYSITFSRSAPVSLTQNVAQWIASKNSTTSHRTIKTTSSNVDIWKSIPVGLGFPFVPLSIFGCMFQASDFQEKHRRSASNFFVSKPKFFDMIDQCVRSKPIVMKWY